MPTPNQTFEPFSIYFADMPFKTSMDERPWVLVEPSYKDGIWNCLPVSGQCFGRFNFEVSKDHADFAATGLGKTSFIKYETYFEVETTLMRRRTGIIAGELLREFLEEAGIDLEE